jgi:hypothetical protein
VPILLSFNLRALQLSNSLTLAPLSLSLSPFLKLQPWLTAVEVTAVEEIAVDSGEDSVVVARGETVAAEAGAGHAVTRR